MTITSEITALLNQLNQELDQIENLATNGLNIIRPILYAFPENYSLIRLFATLNNNLIFVDTSRRRIQLTIDSISAPNITVEVIQEAGEDLAELLGRTLENKILVSRTIAILEELQ
jgi:hypothetical protein